MVLNDFQVWIKVTNILLDCTMHQQMNIDSSLTQAYRESQVLHICAYITLAFAELQLRSETSLLKIGYCVLYVYCIVAFTSPFCTN